MLQPKADDESIGNAGRDRREDRAAPGFVPEIDAAAPQGADL